MDEKDERKFLDKKYKNYKNENFITKSSDESQQNEFIYQQGTNEITEQVRNIDIGFNIEDVCAKIIKAYKEMMSINYYGVSMLVNVLRGSKAKALVDAGVDFIDIEGAGGTSWAAVETYRAEDRYLGEVFWDWGIPTAISTVEVTNAVNVPVISSGGIRTGLEAAKAIALGADAVGMALPFLKNSASQDQLNKFIERFNDSLRIAMFLVGANNIEELKQSKLVIRGKTREWLSERGINTKNYSRR